MRILALSIAVLSLGCVSRTAFVCESDDQCDGEAGGICEADGFCSFPDATCPQGQRYAESAGGGCVGGSESEVDGGIESQGCPGVHEFELDNAGFDVGDLFAAGTVEFPAPLAAATIGGIALIEAGGIEPRIGIANLFENRQLLAGATSLSFEFSGLADGDVFIYAHVDTTGDGVIGEGDWVGFAGGSVASPVQHQPTPTTLAGADQCAIDFGIDTAVCLGDFGDPCSDDRDCRGTVFDCGTSVRSETTDSCGVAGLCVELPEPPNVCGAGGGTPTVRAGGCFGGS